MTTDPPTDPVTDALGQRIVVVSPHLDDGVLSLGAAMASWVRRGARVELLTVFACDPGSDARARGWDARAGFRTEGEAARVRRDEDRRACALLGAIPEWLSYGSIDFERRGDEQEIAAAVLARAEDAASMLVPGFPLEHPDHDWLTRALVARAPNRTRLGLYAEQPYARRAGGTPRLAEWIDHLSAFSAEPVGLRDQLAKWRAIRAYRTQLPLLALRGLRGGPHVLAWGSELVAWSRGAGRANL